MAFALLMPEFIGIGFAAFGEGRGELIMFAGVEISAQQ
jgi:hypothetical protein